MKKSTRALLALGCLLLGGCANLDRPETTATPADSPDATQINVAIYPYVPRPEQFKAVIESAWKEIEPGVELDFIDWDCYSSDPPKDLDVFVFDAIFLDHFHAGGYLEPLAPQEIEDGSDFLPYALEGSRVDGTLYGIPQLGCANILFYREDDDALAAADTLSEVVDAIGQCTYSGETPPPGVGLMVDLAGGTTDACLYLDAVEDIYGEYTPDPPLPPTAAKIDPWAIDNLQQLLRMASVEQARYSDGPYQRGTWFGQGLGRAMVGFTESMSAMGENGRADVAFKLLPLADRDNVSLFYADIIGINPTVNQRGTRELALKLANLMASTRVMVASLDATPEVDYPQYLMPVRESVFRDLKKSFPLYGDMYELVTASHPGLFRIGSRSREWLAAQKDAIRDQIFAAPACE